MSHKLTSLAVCSLFPALILLAGCAVPAAAINAVTSTPQPVAINVATSTPQPAALFTETNSKPSVNSATGATIIRTRIVEVNFPLLSGTGGPASVKTLTLNLFPDVSLTAVLDRVDTQPNGFTWIGHVDGTSNSQVTLVVQDKVMAGSITLTDKIYQVRYAGNGVHAIQQINQAAFPPD
jgi:hypothetical protein